MQKSNKELACTLLMSLIMTTRMLQKLLEVVFVVQSPLRGKHTAQEACAARCDIRCMLPGMSLSQAGLHAHSPQSHPGHLLGIEKTDKLSSLQCFLLLNTCNLSFADLTNISAFLNFCSEASLD